MKLSVEGLEVSYGAAVALRGVDLDVADGEVTAILGPNGAGKSTLLRSIAGLTPPVKGAVRLDGREIHRLPAASIVRLGVALVPQGRQLFPEMTVLENLQLGAYVAPARELPDRLGAALEYFPELANRTHQLAGTLSGGEQQMLAVARALVSRPAVLLLDEPSLGLAPRMVSHIFDILERISTERGCTVVLVEQNARMAFRIARTAHIVVNGRIALRGPVTEMARDATVRHLYLGLREGPGITNGRQRGR